MMFAPAPFLLKDVSVSRVMFQVCLALLVAQPAAGHGGHFGVLTRELQKLRHVAHDVLARQQEFEFTQAVGVSGELLTEKGLHGEGAIGRGGHDGKRSKPGCPAGGLRASDERSS